mgnify:CR=1 FL=1
MVVQLSADPFDQRKVLVREPAMEHNSTLSPWQNVKLPLMLIVVSGKSSTAMTFQIMELVDAQPN